MRAFRPAACFLHILRLPSILFALSVSVAACAEQIPDHVDLQPQGESVEIAADSPSLTAYKLLGTVKGQAAARDLDTATTAARNDLRNKAAALGATLVTVDEDIGQPMGLEGKTRVVMTGRAFKALDADTPGAPPVIKPHEEPSAPASASSAPAEPNAAGSSKVSATPLKK
jgi:hypothetical protein